jgi:hypothetical protein
MCHICAVPLMDTRIAQPHILMNITPAIVLGTVIPFCYQN